MARIALTVKNLTNLVKSNHYPQRNYRLYVQDHNCKENQLNNRKSKWEIQTLRHTKTNKSLKW